MKAFVEKLHSVESHSFYAKTHSTPWFEVGWHQHIELELILFKEGFGKAFIGNAVEDFEAGNIFFLGENLPHTFQKADKDLFVSAVVIQFQKNFWGNVFLNLPECKPLRDLFVSSLQGLKMKDDLQTRLYKLLFDIENKTGLSQIICLTECLQMIEEQKGFEKLSTQEVKEFNSNSREKIVKIHQYTYDHFYEPIMLEQVARLTAMSVPAFCIYFKKATKKTYIEFLNEVRIDNACKFLMDTEKSINDICYNSGFNTIANFNRRFQKAKRMTPTQYRRAFQSNSISI